MINRKIKTTCPYCGVGCGVIADVVADVAADIAADIAADVVTDVATDVKVNVEADTSGWQISNNKELNTEQLKYSVTGVSGDQDHPANLGRLCVKGSSLHETLGDQGRLLKPMVNGVEQDWDTAIDHVANQLNRIIDEHGPESVAFYLSGQLLTEDYYVANKLAKGFIKTPHVDTNSRLCMSSAVAAYKQTLGADAVPCDYTDLDQANLLVLVGSNAAWAHPILYQRMVAAKQTNPDLKVVVIDPRVTATTDLADLHLAIKPDSDIWLFNGLLNYLQQQNYIDHAFVEQATSGMKEALDAANNCSLAKVSGYTGIPVEQLKQFYDWFAATENSVTFYSQGINQSTVGTDKNCSIINCHLLTGRIGKAGMGPFSITGQPNAMGGREVGGLANMLAAHMNYSEEEKDRVARFWQVDQVCDGPGLKAVDLFDAMDQGKIKAVWIMATNPVVSMPEADKVARALRKCELVVVSDCYRQTDTGQLADVLLPATGWGEKDGTVTNSERRISRQRPLLPATGEARHDWLIMSQVAQRMGFKQGFDYSTPHQIFVEHARLSEFENNGQRAFDIGALAELDAQAYEDLTPVQWPLPKSMNSGDGQTRRLFADGKFFTNNHKAQFKTIKLVDITAEPDSKAIKSLTPNVFVLNSGRSRDQWHTMTRTGRTKRLLEHQDMPYLSINQGDASAQGIQAGDLVRITAAGSNINANTASFDQSVIATAKIDAGIGSQQVFMPIHWTDQFTSNSRVCKAIGPQTDNQSGQPGFKQAQVTLENVDVAYTAYWLIRHESAVMETAAKRDQLLQACCYWSRVPFNDAGLYRLYFADQADMQHFIDQQTTTDLKVCRYQNSLNGDQRFLGYQAGRIDFALFVSAKAQHGVSALPDKTWMMQLLEQQFEGSPWQLLAGRSVDQVDLGPVVCACFGVHKNSITEAIGSGCLTAEQLGQTLKCGTNCGSCIPELKQLIIDHQPE